MQPTLKRGWWNRQTREFEGLVVEIPCGFKSRPAHTHISRDRHMGRPNSDLE